MKSIIFDQEMGKFILLLNVCEPNFFIMKETWRNTTERG